jgi:ribose transport system permease protein
MIEHKNSVAVQIKNFVVGPNLRARFLTFMESDACPPIILLGLCLLIILLSRFVNPNLGGFDQIASIIVLSSFLMVVAFGQQMVVLIGGLDLSIPSLVTLGGILSYQWAASSLSGTIAIVLLVMLIGATIGSISGLGVSKLNIPPFIMTLSTGIIIYGVILGGTGGTPRGVSSPYLEQVFSARWFGLPPIVFFTLPFIACATVLQRGTSFGRKLYALGSNPQAAKVAGLQTTFLTSMAYAISGAAACLCGALLVGYSSGATLQMGQFFLMPSVAAVVIGGTAITGGKGTYIAAATAALFITSFGTVASSIQLAEGWRTIIYGSIVLIAITVMRDRK